MAYYKQQACFVDFYVYNGTRRHSSKISPYATMLILNLVGVINLSAIY